MSGEADKRVVVDIIGRDKASGPIREAARSAKDAERDFSALGDTSAKLNQVSNALAGMAAAATALGPVSAGVGQLASAAVAATGSLLALPAAAASAAAALGVVKVGISGVGDAIKDGLDPNKVDKFDAALANLAPSARSLVKEIVRLQPTFNGLRISVQQELFEGLAGSVRRLARQWLPGLAGGLRGVASAVNSARGPLERALGDRETLGVAQRVLTATAGAARELTGAIEPVVSIVRDLVDVGTSFLPGFARGFADSAQSAAAWVHQLKETGQLRGWLVGGIHALGELRDIAVAVGRGFRDDVLPPIRRVVDFMSAHRDDVSKFAGALAAAAVAIRGSVAGALAALSTPLGLVVAGVALVGGALAAAYVYVQPFHDAVDSLAKDALPAVADAARRFGAWWSEYVQPPLEDAARELLPRLNDVWVTLQQNFGPGTETWRFFQQTLAVVGPLLKDLVIPAFTKLASAGLSAVNSQLKLIGFAMNNIVVPAIKFMAQIFEATVGGMLHAADSAFGWIPGIGPKLHAAAQKFDQFAADVNNALNGIDTAKTITVTAIYSNQGTSGSGRDEGADGRNRSTVTSGSGRDEGSRASATSRAYGGGTGGSSNVTYAMRWLMQQGFSRSAAAGVVGNLQGESGKGLNPHSVGDHGTSYGIAQWHNERWNNLVGFAKQRGLSWTDMSTQLQFLMHEISQGGAGVSLSQLKKMSAQQVVSYLVRYFERPADIQGNISARTSNALSLLGQSGGGAGSGGGIASVPVAGARPKSRASALKGVANTLGHGFVSGMAGTSKQVYGLFVKLFNDLQDAGGKGAMKVARVVELRLLKMATTHDQITKRIAAATATIKNLQKQTADTIRQTHDDVVKSGSVADSDGTYGGMVDRLRRSVAFAGSFAKDITRLKAMGLDSTTLSQIVAMGPEAGYQAAESLLASGKGGISQLASLQKQLSAAGTSLGKSTADALYGAGLHAAEGLLAGLKRQEKALVAQMEHLAQALVTALRKKLKIHSPSRVFAELGGHIGTGLALGIDGSAPTVARSVAGLVPVPAGGTIGAARAGAGGAGTLHVHNHFHGAVAERRHVVEWVAEGLRQAPTRGVRLA
jgi:hypothetical protein